MKLITDNTKLRLPIPGYRIKGLSLAPHLEAGRENVCKAAGFCPQFCVLKKVGFQNMPNVRKAAVERTHFMFDKPVLFRRKLLTELDEFEIECATDEVVPLFRPNTASDLDWDWLARERESMLMYDYTKHVERLGRSPANYELTYSWNMHSHKREAEIAKYLMDGGNIAVIVDTVYRKNGTRPFVGSLPSHIKLFGKWHETVDFDRHDGRLRRFDGEGRVGLLRWKGARKKGSVLDVARRKGEVLRQDSSFFRFERLPMDTNTLEAALTIDAAEALAPGQTLPA